MGAAGASPVCGSVLGSVFLGDEVCGPAAFSLAPVEGGAASVALDVHLKDGGVVGRGGRRQPPPWFSSGNTLFQSPKGWLAVISRERLS